MVDPEHSCWKAASSLSGSPAGATQATGEQEVPRGCAFCGPVPAWLRSSRCAAAQLCCRPCLMEFSVSEGWGTVRRLCARADRRGVPRPARLGATEQVQMGDSENGAPPGLQATPLLSQSESTLSLGTCPVCGCAAHQGNRCQGLGVAKAL